MMASAQELVQRLIDAVLAGELTAVDLVAKAAPSPQFLGQAWRFVVTRVRERACTAEIVRAIEILCARDPGFSDGSFILGMANYHLGQLDAAATAFERHCVEGGPRSEAARQMLATVDALRARRVLPIES